MLSLDLLPDLFRQICLFQTLPQLFLLLQHPRPVDFTEIGVFDLLFRFCKRDLFAVRELLIQLLDFRLNLLLRLAVQLFLLL